jgi:hypothetical protein
VQSILRLNDNNLKCFESHVPEVAFPHEVGNRLVEGHIGDNAQAREYEHLVAGISFTVLRYLLKLEEILGF